MHLWILLSTPLLAVTSELSPSASQQTDSNVHSRHFAVRTGDDGSREVVSLDSAGPAFELAGALAVFGPDDIFLVLDPEASGGLRDVRLMDASFAQVSAFEIPVDLAPLLGGQGLVLRRMRSGCREAGICRTDRAVQADDEGDDGERRRRQTESRTSRRQEVAGC